MSKLNGNEVLTALREDFIPLYEANVLVAHYNSQALKVRQAINRQKDNVSPGLLATSLELQLNLFRAQRQREEVSFNVKI